MPRTKRHWVSEENGSFHVISRTAGRDIWLNDQEKEYFMVLMERFAAGFFVEIHAFCVMSTHFHILVTGLNTQGQHADKKELLRRYRLIYGENAEPPEGSYQPDGNVIPDDDGGIERLRQRLGSVSRFVQELKQAFTCWFNKKHRRKGYLWGERFKSVVVQKGEPQLTCSTYIDLNPVRAGIVEIPEDYRWSSLGLKVRNPERSRKLLGAVFHDSMKRTGETGNKNVSQHQLSWYREFVYVSGGFERQGSAKIPQVLVEDVRRWHGKLGLHDCLRYRVRNISEGVAIGTYEFISQIQESFKRKFIRPRSFLPAGRIFATRVLR